MNGKKDKKSISKKKMAIIISLSVLAIIIGTVLFGYQYFKSKIYVAPSDTNSYKYRRK